MNGDSSGTTSTAAIRVRLPGPVVMVDDNPGDIELARLGYVESVLDNPWLSFRGGRDFLEHLAAVRRQEHAMPALTLLDLNMPHLNGFEVLSSVRADPFFHQLPVFCMLTSSNDPRDRIEGERRGASGFVVKPDSIDDYITFFDRLEPESGR